MPPLLLKEGQAQNEGKGWKKETKGNRLEWRVDHHGFQMQLTGQGLKIEGGDLWPPLPATVLSNSIQTLGSNFSMKSFTAIIS